MNSPEYIQTSLAAAISLGLEKGSFKDNIKLTGLNLLLTYDGGCIGRCAYCGLSRIPRQDSPHTPGIPPSSEGDSPDEHARGYGMSRSREHECAYGVCFGKPCGFPR